MFRVLLRAKRGYKVPASAPCFGFRIPKVSPPKHPNAEQLANQIANGNLVRLVTAYRTHGHKKAATDPLGLHVRVATELNPALYGFSTANNQKYKTDGILHTTDPNLHEATISQIIDHLEKTYCQSIGVEFERKQSDCGLLRRLRPRHLKPCPKTRIAELLTKCDTFDNFMQVRYASVKRYGAEGAESLIPFMDELFHASVKSGIEDVALGMPHRGRLNLMTILLKYPSSAIFNKLMGKRELPPGSQGVGDVLSHLHQCVDLDVAGHKLHVTLLPNPSHLEAVNPVIVGKARARQDFFEQKRDVEFVNFQRLLNYLKSARHPETKSLCVQIHGDAAFAGQGVVPETFQMANLPHYSVGGSIHLIVNNQIGFTTPSDRGRSSRYSSDIAKIINCPVLHVNGDDPEAVVRSAQIAVDYRTRFHKDVLVDLIAFRRRGHNEMDDPTLTQPVMYKTIHSHMPVDQSYGIHLEHRGVVNKAQLEAARKQFWNELDAQMKVAAAYVAPETMHLQEKWAGLTQATPRKTTIDTGVDVATLNDIGIKSVTLPVHDAAIHERLARAHIDARLQAVKSGDALDWATVEAMAFGSLLSEGHNVRISGQDVGRGTFSQRHLMVVDQNTDTAYVPLNYIHSNQGFIEIANSFLSEAAVVGFEYGYSIDNPNNLVIWEAQFGDFFNTAQSMFDTFVTCGETKWLKQTGLVVLLPHGYDGMGPEHSSCRLERWLQMCDGQQKIVDGDNVNLLVAHPTTPAQYFHLLRRQLKRNFRKPLIIASPKLLLRHPVAKSVASELGPGTRFHPVLDDPTVTDKQRVKKVILCSGKFYYELTKSRPHDANVPVIRLEELSPFPAAELKSILAQYPGANDFTWVQEEPENQGPWTFVQPRLFYQCKITAKYIGRPALPTPAVGYGEAHKKQLETILQDAFKK